MIGANYELARAVLPKGALKHLHVYSVGLSPRDECIPISIHLGVWIRAVRSVDAYRGRKASGMIPAIVSELAHVNLVVAAVIL